MHRRTFSRNSLAAGLGLTVLPSAIARSGIDLLDGITEQQMRAFLSGILYTREEVDDYFAGRAFPFSKHSAAFGWLLPDAYFRDGVNDSISKYTYVQPDGERLMSNYADRPCRINTYGNSFTQCHQVSDHETWQEVLAAHLQEPVRNFGIGGWSVYQAYLRMLKEEERTPGSCIIFNIYSDDHYRNLDAWRNIRVRKHPRFIEPPLPHLTVDLKARTYREHANPTPTQEDFYRLCDLDETYAIFKDDFVAKVRIAHDQSKERNEALNYREIHALTTTHGIETSLDENATLSQVVSTYHRECALFSTERIVEKIISYAQLNSKKLLFVLSYPAGYLAEAQDIGQRWDQSFIDFLQAKNLDVVDLGQAHLDEYHQFNITFKAYLERYFIGHYNPLGNMFCAQALIKPLVEMLKPKPPAYHERKDVMR